MSGKLPGRLPPRTVGAPVAPEAPPPTEFDEAEKTPPGVLITPQEKTIVRASIRTVVRGVVPFLPKVAAAIVPAIVAWMLSASHVQSAKEETEKKVKVTYGTLAPVSNEQAKEIAELKRAFAQLADSVAAQGRLGLASRPGFDDKGKPETPAVAKRKRLRHAVAPPADPTIVKKVQEDAAKNAALKALVVQKPTPAPVPTELPAEVPKPQPQPQTQPPAPPTVPDWFVPASPTPEAAP